MTTQKRRKYLIILLEGIASGGVRKISFKVPANIKHCKGIMFSSNVPGQAGKNYILGNVSLFFNDKKSHPLHYTIHSKPDALLKRKIEILKLDQPVCPGSFIQGYYADLGLAISYPHKVRIYLECEQEISVSKKK